MSHIHSAARAIIPLAVLFILLGIFGAKPAQAGGVVGTGSAGSCTETALDNALSGGGTVTFNCGPAPVTINFSFIKTIQVNTTIKGGDKITLKTSNAYHFQVYSEKTLSLKSIKLTGGNYSITGSIENFGTTKTNHVTFFKNKSTGTAGAILNSGKLVVKNTTFLKNRAAEGGGAIWNEGGNTTIKASTFKKNKATDPGAQGGAVANRSGDVRLIGSTLLENSADVGGAVWTDIDSTNSISNSTLNNNKGSDGAGLVNFGGMEITNSTISNNVATSQGGGIYHGGFLSITTSTIKGNQATTGGGIRNFGNSFFISRSTISGNTASGDGGGVFSSTDTELENSTLSGNHAGASGGGGGGWFQYTHTATFRFVTVADNTASYGAGINADGASTPDSFINLQNTALATNTGGNCAGASIVSAGYNLSTDTYCGVLSQPSDRKNTAAGIGALANNGGPTFTHLPSNGSALINKGLNDSNFPTDQRGLPRPIGGKSDIGAVEVQ